METFSILSIKRNKKKHLKHKAPPPLPSKKKEVTSLRHINGNVFGSAFLIILNYVALMMAL
jgi:ribosomal protein S10